MNTAMQGAQWAAGWRILADDLTGALDTAAAFSGLGSVPVFWDPIQAQRSDGAPVQALSTGTRDVAPATFQEQLRAALPWFKSAHAPCFTFKKIDSLLRGNTFAEIAWLVQNGGFDAVVFAPAYPKQGRITQNGQHRPVPPQQVLAPGTGQTIDLTAAFAKVGLSAQTGRLTAHAMAESLSGHGPKACVVLAPDVLTDSELAKLATLTTAPNLKPQRWLWCGSAGLAWALARQMGLAPAPTISPARTAGRPVLVSASRHPVLRAQLSTIEAGCKRLDWPLPTDLLQNTAQDGRPVLIDLASEETLAATTAKARLAAYALNLASALPRPDPLIVVGGDTLLALCQATKTPSLRAGPSPQSGWGQARLQGGTWDGVVCYSRSGAFGAPDDLSELLKKITHKESSP